MAGPSGPVPLVGLLALESPGSLDLAGRALSSGLSDALARDRRHPACAGAGGRVDRCEAPGARTGPVWAPAGMAAGYDIRLRDRSPLPLGRCRRPGLDGQTGRNTPTTLEDTWTPRMTLALSDSTAWLES